MAIASVTPAAAAAPRPARRRLRPRDPAVSASSRSGAPSSRVHVAPAFGPRTTPAFPIVGRGRLGGRPRPAGPRPGPRGRGRRCPTDAAWRGRDGRSSPGARPVPGLPVPPASRAVRADRGRSSRFRSSPGRRLGAPARGGPDLVVLDLGDVVREPSARAPTAGPAPPDRRRHRCGSRATGARPLPRCVRRVRTSTRTPTPVPSAALAGRTPGPPALRSPARGPSGARGLGRPAWLPRRDRRVILRLGSAATAPAPAPAPAAAGPRRTRRPAPSRAEGARRFGREEFLRHQTDSRCPRSV